MPRIRCDILDVYIFRRTGLGAGATSSTFDVLQLLRSPDGPQPGTWQPVMGHVESGETAVQAAMRELREEVGLSSTDAALLGVWALQGVHPYFLAGADAVMLGPRFAAEVSTDWAPVLNAEHTNHRWMPAREAADWFMWPGQAAAIAEAVSTVLLPDAPLREALRIR